VGKLIEVKILPLNYNYITFIDHIKKIVYNVNNYQLVYGSWARESNNCISLLEFE